MQLKVVVILKSVAPSGEGRLRRIAFASEVLDEATDEHRRRRDGRAQSGRSYGSAGDGWEKVAQKGSHILPRKRRSTRLDRRRRTWRGLTSNDARDIVQASLALALRQAQINSCKPERVAHERSEGSSDHRHRERRRMPLVLSRREAPRRKRWRKKSGRSSCAGGPISSTRRFPAGGLDRGEYMEKKFGKSGRLQSAHDNLTRLGAEVGVPFAFDQDQALAQHARRPSSHPLGRVGRRTGKGRRPTVQGVFRRRTRHWRPRRADRNRRRMRPRRQARRGAARRWRGRRPGARRRSSRRRRWG